MEKNPWSFYRTGGFSGLTGAARVNTSVTRPADVPDAQEEATVCRQHATASYGILCLHERGISFKVDPVWHDCKMPLRSPTATTGSREVTGRKKQNKKGGREAVQTAVGGVWGSWLYYLDQALFHMSTHLLFAPSQWGTAQRTYLPPLLRLPPLHLPYASWTSRRKEKTEHISLTWSHFFSLIFSSAWIGLSVGNIQSFLYFTPFSVMAPPPHGRI